MIKPTVCCVTPPSAFLLDERVFLSLGILKVAASLEARGYPVEHVDLSGVANYEEAIATHANTSPALYYAITATTPQMPAAARIAAVLRAAAPSCKLIIGGPHATLTCAAIKKEQTPGRATRALEQLLDTFHVVVAGDGEDAIVQALHSKWGVVVDADDPKGTLFLTNKRLAETPWPARHLVDVSSYHYTIEGRPSGSLVGQLGCLAAGTMIRMANGRDVPIEDVRVGDSVVCWDEKRQQLAIGPVAAAWSRDADDLWDLRLSSCATILVTSEHPIWTEFGWKKVVELEPGDKIAYVPDLPPRIFGSAAPDNSALLLSALPQGARDARLPDLLEGVRVDTGVRVGGELLLAPVSSRMAETPRQREVAALGTASDEGKMGRDVARRARRELQHRTVEGQHQDSQGSSAPIRDEAWRSQSDEACGCRREGIPYDSGETHGLLFRANEEDVAGRPNARDLGERRARPETECGREGAGGTARVDGAELSICGQRGILDRAVPVGEASQSGLHRPGRASGDSSARRVLALGGVSGGRDSGLSEQGMGGAGGLVEGTAPPTAHRAVGQDSKICYAEVASRRWIGRSRVYNITVCPGHSYLANNVIVHNCPFACTFCGGRASPMLRRVRTRSTEQILDELEHLHRVYNYTGFMFYDDELNVNRSMVELMRGIAALQKRLGVEFRLRGFVKAELFTQEQANVMFEAGFRWLLCGFESGSPRILDNINKKADVDDNDRAVEYARNAGLKIKALMSLGHAGESAETIADTKAWLLRMKPNDFDATIITPYPGSPYYDEAQLAALQDSRKRPVWVYTAPRSSDRLYAYELDYFQEADYYKGSPDGGYVSHVFTDHLTSEELVRLRDDLENDVRAQLGIPFNPGAPGIQFEASMGQTKLPPNILRESSISRDSGTHADAR